MYIRTKKNQNFTIFDTALKDKELTWQAKGLLSYLLHLPDDWQIYVSELHKNSKNGRDATANYLNELIEAGYVVRESRRENGRFKGYEYRIGSSKDIK